MRGWLHVRQLPTLRVWLIYKGWKLIPPASGEAIRAESTKLGKATLILHLRNNSEHVTVSGGWQITLVRTFLEETSHGRKSRRRVTGDKADSS